MEQATTIGLDIAKHVFQVHGADGAGHVLFRKRITRVKLLGFLAAQARCVVAMEACAGAHYWAREIGKLGHHVRLIAPIKRKPLRGTVRIKRCFSPESPIARRAALMRLVIADSETMRPSHTACKSSSLVTTRSGCCTR